MWPTLLPHKKILHPEQNFLGLFCRMGQVEMEQFSIEITSYNITDGIQLVQY